MAPITASPRITETLGVADTGDAGALVKAGTVIGGAGVNVGRRVVVGATVGYCAKRVGSIVGGGGWGGVGGGSTIRKVPGDT